MVATKHYAGKRRMRERKGDAEEGPAINPSSIILPKKIEHWPIKRLIPYPDNAWRHDSKQVKKIMASIVENNWTNPILVDETDMILSGHGRRLAAINLKMPRVPVIRILGLTPAQKRAYRLADNRLTLDGSWDDDLLDKELRALKDLDYNLELTGFELDELAARLEQPDWEEMPAPKPPPRPVSRPGDLWILGRHRLLCEKSEDPKAVDRLLKGAKVHLVNTDPPYNVKVEPRSNLAIAQGITASRALKHHQ